MKATKRIRRIRLILIGMLCLCVLLCLGQRLCQRKTPPVLEAPIETESKPALTLESLLGEDYVQFVTDTITMQMENRMVKNPEVRFYPVEDQAPLSNYIAINEQTQFELGEDGYLVILFPAGTVTDPTHGEQRFRVLDIMPTGERIEIPDPVVDWKLLLVNPWNPLPDDFGVNLTQLRNGQAIDSRAYPDWQKMRDEARADGLSPLICSS